MSLEIELDQHEAKLRRSYENKKQKYAKHAVSNVRPLWLKGVDSDTVYPQECFYRAFRYATDIDRIEENGIWLVFGECGWCFGRHAWVEMPDGLVFDGVFQQFYRTEDWEKEILGQAWYKFTPDAAFLISCYIPKTDDGLTN